MNKDRKYVVLLNGPPRSGKDTAAKVLEGLDYKHLKFSAALKQEAHDRYGMTDKPVDYFEKVKDTALMEFDGHTPREVYIDVGTEMREKYGPGVFGEMVCDQIMDSDKSRFVVSDLANLEEALPLLNNPNLDVAIIRLHRIGHSFEGDCRNYVSGHGILIKDIQNENLEKFQREIKASSMFCAVSLRHLPELNDPVDPYFEAQQSIRQKYKINIDDVTQIKMNRVVVDEIGSFDILDNGHTPFDKVMNTPLPFGEFGMLARKEDMRSAGNAWITARVQADVSYRPGIKEGTKSLDFPFSVNIGEITRDGVMAFVDAGLRRRETGAPKDIAVVNLASNLMTAKTKIDPDSFKMEKKIRPI